jgi:hypothetical protein
MYNPFFLLPLTLIGHNHTEVLTIRQVIGAYQVSRHFSGVLILERAQIMKNVGYFIPLFLMVNGFIH